jgi:hypothetical protein
MVYTLQNSVVLREFIDKFCSPSMAAMSTQFQHGIPLVLAIRGARMT